MSASFLQTPFFLTQCILVLCYIWTPTHGFVHVGQPAKTYINSVWTLDVVWRTYQEWWIIGIDSKRESGNSQMMNKTLLKSSVSRYIYCKHLCHGKTCLRNFHRRKVWCIGFLQCNNFNAFSFLINKIFWVLFKKKKWWEKIFKLC